MKRLSLVLIASGVFSTPMFAADLIWPQNRTTFASDERIEVAVAGLMNNETATIQFRPQQSGATPVTIQVKGVGTGSATLPPLALAPDNYEVVYQGKPTGTLKIVPGVWRSNLLVSATSITAPDGGNNAVVGNLFRFGLLDEQGQPLADVRGKKSPGMYNLESWLGSGLPTLVYMYWTGFVTHKPWGTEKSWANGEIQEAMRLFNFANAQRMRSYHRAIAAVGPIDEPGLGWGKTPAGGSASGFPNWDEKPWYQAQGWKYTQDIAAQSDADWMKYVNLRAKILEDSYRQANRDIKSVWPTANFEGDLYAPSAIMDGTNPLNQRANDTPTTHVFFDFFGGPLSVPGLLALEKSHDPSALVAHAMNGQLTGERGPQAPLYHQLMNAMLQGGLKSNWWLNTGSLSREELTAVHAPAERFGPMLQKMKSRPSVALLWGHTELAMRQKQMAARESTKTGGEQIKLMVPLPQAGELSEAELISNAYEVGGTYSNQILYTHQALIRSGYPTHIIHESTVAEGALDSYKVLVITGQQAELPSPVRSAIENFVAGGGRVVVDRTTTVKFPNAIVHEAKLGEANIRSWTASLESNAKKATNTREQSRFNTIGMVIAPAIEAVQPIKKAMARTQVIPSLSTDSTDFAVQRLEGGEGAIYMVLNGHEELPYRNEAQAFPRYNPGPYRATYSLKGIPTGSTVFKIQGLDWASNQEITKTAISQTEEFAAGEMKLYLVAPRKPRGLMASAKTQDGTLQIKTQLSGLRMPWPLQIEIRKPTGEALYTLYRTTGSDGTFVETLPLGANAQTGIYTVTFSSPVAGLKTTTAFKHTSSSPTVASIDEKVRIFDEQAVQTQLASGQSLTIAVGDESQRLIADKLATQLAAKGMKVRVQSEKELLRKVTYPRIWNAFATLYSPSDKENALPEGTQALHQITLSINEQGEELAISSDAKPINTDWRRPNTLVTVGASGWLDWMGQDREVAYEAGTKFFINEKMQLVVINGQPREVETTDSFRTRWARPWTKLSSYGGNYQLPPQLPEAYKVEGDLIVLGDSHSSQLARILQASELLPRIVDSKYPGTGKALIQYAWSPFTVEKNVIFVGASDTAGLSAGAERLVLLAK